MLTNTMRTISKASKINIVIICRILSK